MIPVSDERLLPIKQVIELTRISRPMIYTEMRAGRFLRPVKIGTKSVRWRFSEISAWMASLEPALGDLGR